MTRPTIFLHTLDSAMAVAWRSAFTDVAGIYIVEGDILEGRCDAVVSKANSFGFMDGGIDLAYRQYFGMELESRVQAKIRSEFCGELPVGQAPVVPTGNETVPYLVAAPTMRIPDHIGDTVRHAERKRPSFLRLVVDNTATGGGNERNI